MVNAEILKIERPRKKEECRRQKENAPRSKPKAINDGMRR